jgi:hypothetical protein
MSTSCGCIIKAVLSMQLHCMDNSLQGCALQHILQHIQRMQDCSTVQELLQGDNCCKVLHFCCKTTAALPRTATTSFSPGQSPPHVTIAAVVWRGS